MAEIELSKLTNFAVEDNILLTSNEKRRLLEVYYSMLRTLVTLVMGWIDIHMWNPIYFVTTVLENTEEHIRKYIQIQK